MATDSLAQYDYLRQKVGQGQSAQAQAEEEALKRRLAAAGALNTGAAIKQQELQGESAIQRREQALQDISLQEAAAKQQLAEVEKARQFQTSEREAGQRFGAEQAGIGRQYSTGERVAGQEFGAGQAALGRQYATGERQAGQAYATGERTAQQQFGAEEAAKVRSLQSEQFNKNYDQHLKEYADTFKLNAVEMARKQVQDVQMLMMAQDQAAADKLATLLNYGTLMAGPDANAPEIARWVDAMKKWAATGGSAPIALPSAPSSQQNAEEMRTAYPTMGTSFFGKPSFNPNT